MFDPPKDLPHITPPQQPVKGGSLQAPAFSPGNLVVKTETPLHEARNNALPLLEVPQNQEIIIAPPSQRKELSLPRIEQEMPNFDDAIKSIHQDLMRIETEEKREKDHGKRDLPEAPSSPEPKQEEYYTSKNLGEGYFSEIRHYLKNKDSKEIVDDIIKKDFLNGMRDYHDQKGQGKPFYLHDEDLKEKLEQKMEFLMRKEETWHEAKKASEEQERRKRLLEKEIDEEAQELKDLFKLIKANQILEKEATQTEQFILRSGQKLKSLNDLRKALIYMHDDEFSHHVNPPRNDFANWTEKALSLPEVAQKMRTAKSKEELAQTLKTSSF